MFSLIANISVDKVYQMDDHMYNIISTSVEILSALIGVIALFVGLYGIITFFRINKKIKNQDNKLKINIDEVKNLKKEVYSELNKLQKVNINIIVNNIYGIIVQMIGSNNEKEIDLKLTELIESIGELIFTVPNKNLTVKQGMFLSEKVSSVIGYISIVVEGKTELEGKIKCKKVFDALEVLSDKVSFRNIDTFNMSKENERYIQFYLNKINESMIKIKKNIKGSTK